MSCCHDHHQKRKEKKSCKPCPVIDPCCVVVESTGPTGPTGPVGQSSTPSCTCLDIIRAFFTAYVKCSVGLSPTTIFFTNVVTKGAGSSTMFSVLSATPFTINLPSDMIESTVNLSQLPGGFTGTAPIAICMADIAAIQFVRLQANMALTTERKTVTRKGLFHSPPPSLATVAQCIAKTLCGQQFTDNPCNNCAHRMAQIIDANPNTIVAINGRILTVPNTGAVRVTGRANCPPAKNILIYTQNGSSLQGLSSIFNSLPSDGQFIVEGLLVYFPCNIGSINAENLI